MFVACPMTIGIDYIAKNFVPWYLGIDFLPAVTAISIISPIVISNSLASISGKHYFTVTYTYCMC